LDTHALGQARRNLSKSVLDVLDDCKGHSRRSAAGQSRRRPLPRRSVR
jgi:hypothetical protein